MWKELKSSFHKQSFLTLKMTFSLLMSVYIKFFFLLTPFFIISVFLSVTEKETKEMQHRLAVKVTSGVVCISLILFLFGDVIFSMLGITVDAFRIGAGALLFLSAVSLSQGSIQLPSAKNSVIDLAIVPLAIPMTLGPGSVGALIVMGTETLRISDKISTGFGIALACLTVGALLYLCDQIKRLIGANGISMLSKITGLVLAALSCQMMFTGIAEFLK